VCITRDILREVRHLPKARTLIAAAAVSLAAAAALAPADAAPAPARTAARTATPRPSHVGALLPAHRGELLPRSGSAEAGTPVATLNWAGYAVTPPAGHGITAVHTSFVVPTVSDVIPGFAATWTGIGGYTSADLIQAGVGEQFAPGFGPSYYVWYETLPDSEIDISGCTGDANCSVSHGDAISVGISMVSPGHWLITMNDVHRWSWHTTVTYTSSESSAEWVLEAPTVAVQTVLPTMSATAFGAGDSYSLDGGPARTIASGDPLTMQMLSLGAVAEGLPSSLAGAGTSFNACAYATACATPTAAPRATPKT
jgi:peptidase A4-like protein